MSHRYRAIFEPQSWIDDNAVEVDPEGETSWDCTASVASNPEYFKGIDKFIEYNGSFLDNDDLLHSDPEAPEWVREWTGPFTITVEWGE